MKILKPNFWKKINLITISLMPLSLIVRLIILLKRYFIKKLTYKIPIICVGNIYIGGTGKTPLSINLAKELSILKKKPVILRKYYKQHKDEFSIIENNFKHLITNKNRHHGIMEAVEKGFDTVILDDGFQDYKIKKNLSIVCFNNHLLGNGLVIPAGPLREGIDSLKFAQVAVINGLQDLSFEKKLLSVNHKISIFYSKYIPIDIDRFKGKKLLAIAGIGNPENFFEVIKENSLVIGKKLAFPDHYQFSKSEILNIIKYAKENDYQIVMTEKDHCRIKNFNFEEIESIKVKLKIFEKEKFLRKILTVYD